MRSRVVLLVAVVALGIATITLAQQQPADRQKSSDKKALRSEVARLRAEVELMELEHDRDIDLLKDLMADLKKADPTDSVKNAKSRLAALGAAFGNKVDDKSLQDIENPFSVDDVAANGIRPWLERMSKEFVKKAAELNEKRLELGEVEKQYQAAK